MQEQPLVRPPFVRIFCTPCATISYASVFVSLFRHIMLCITWLKVFCNSHYCQNGVRKWKNSICKWSDSYILLGDKKICMQNPTKENLGKMDFSSQHSLYFKCYTVYYLNQYECIYIPLHQELVCPQ